MAKYLCAVGIDAIETRENTFKAWVSVAYEKFLLLFLSSQEQNASKITEVQVDFIPMRFCPPEMEPQAGDHKTCFAF